MGWKAAQTTSSPVQPTASPACAEQSCCAKALTSTSTRPWRRPTFIANSAENGFPCDVLAVSCLKKLCRKMVLGFSMSIWNNRLIGVAKSWTRLSDVTFTFHFHALEKEMATHSSVLAWRIPSPCCCLGSHRVGHDWSDLAAAAAAGSCLLVVLLHYYDFRKILKQFFIGCFWVWVSG